MKEFDTQDLELTDDEGKKHTFKALFSIHWDVRKTTYIYVYDPEDKDENSVLVLGSTDDKPDEIFTVDSTNDPELTEYLDDTLQAFQNGDLKPVEDDDGLNEYEETKDGECECQKHGEHHENETCCSDHCKCHHHE